MRYLILIVGVLFLFACSDNKEVNEITDGDVKREGKMDSCDCADLLIDSTGLHTRNGDPYTGVCTDYYPNSTDRYIDKDLLDGLLHGTVTYYARTGEELMKEMYESGKKKRSGDTDFLVCDCTELEKVPNPDPQLPIRYFLDEIPYTGICQKFYPESTQLYVESNYKSGLLDGASTYYDQQGNVLYIEEYKMGTMINVLHQEVN